MGFFQLLVAGIALATRFEESREVRTVIKDVPRIITIRLPADPQPVDPIRSSPVASHPPIQPPIASQPLPPPTPVATPQTGDPRAERMVKEARQARVAGDMGVAIVKLEEALSLDAEDPVVNYELGVVHEQMGVFGKASDYYEKVFQMGVSKAGALYGLAAGKLRDGFEQPDAMLGKLSLGRVQIFKDPKNEAGQRVILTIPVQKAPGEELDPGKVSVEVLYFNRTSKGEIIQLQREDRGWSKEAWLNPPFDWADGQEDLRAIYTIPPQDSQTEHLFGERTYYGQVVILHYGEEVIDVQAWPRDLAAKIPSQSSSKPGAVQPAFQEPIPSDFDPSLGVLPPLPTLPQK